jgi:hypothetical protein
MMTAMEISAMVVFMVWLSVVTGYKTDFVSVMNHNTDLTHWVNYSMNKYSRCLP